MTDSTPDISPQADMTDIQYEYLRIDYVDKRIEAVMNATRMIQQAGFPDCCYQMAEAMAHALREMGLTDARAMACDVYGWNHHFFLLKQGITSADKRAKKPTKKMKAISNRHPQRKKGFKGKKSKKDWRTKWDPYSLAMYHEQECYGDGYDGHVLCVVGEWVICTTFGQFSRPKRRVQTTDSIIIPLESFQAMPDALMQNGWCEWREPVLGQQGWLTTEVNITDGNPDGQEWFQYKSIQPELISFRMSDAKSRDGNIAVCLRPDIEPDTWLNHRTHTRKNVERTNEMVLKCAKNMLDNNGTGSLILD